MLSRAALASWSTDSLSCWACWETAGCWGGRLGCCCGLGRRGGRLLGGSGLGLLGLIFGEAGGNDGDPDLVLQAFVEGGAEDGDSVGISKGAGTQKREKGDGMT